MSKSEDPLDDSMTVVKTSTCDTLTKKSKLTYQIGTLPDGEVYFRIHTDTHLLVNDRLQDFSALDIQTFNDRLG